MSEWKVRRVPPLQWELEVPGDKSISHRAVMLAALSNGPCVLKGFLASEDCLCTVAAMRALGVEIEAARAEHAHRARPQARLHRAQPAISIAATPAPPCACSPGSSPASPSAAGSIGDRLPLQAPDEARHRAAHRDGREAPRRGRERPPAAGHRGRAAPADPLLLARRQRAGEKRGAPRRPVCQRQDQRHRAHPEPRPHRAHARVLPRPPAADRSHRLDPRRR